MFTPTLSIFLFFWMGGATNIAVCPYIVTVTVCKCVVCYIWKLEQPILAQLLSGYKLNQEMCEMLTEKTLC